MINAVHIEDEPRNIELLASLVKEHCSDMVNLVGNARNVKDAISLIRSKKPKLIYLDIELNQGNAFDLLQKLKEHDEFDFQVIFITAFNEYAVKAFRFNAVDYLLKPISIVELKDATLKVVNKITQSSGNDHVLEAIRLLKPNFNTYKTGLPVVDGVVFINTEEIIKAEAKGSYSTLHLSNNKKITTTKNLKDLEDILPGSLFIRVHHSWIINIKYLKKYYRGKNSYMELEDGSTVAVSVRKKGKLLDFL
jgi:two-component system LytT family response regulator